MKYKYSILICLTSVLTGFIPLKTAKTYNITYTIYSQNLVSANKIKEELIVFYKQYCYSFLLSDINEKINQNIHLFPYQAEYQNHEILVFDTKQKIKMTGFLYKHSPSFIDFKNYFTSSANSIPDATSIKVETLSVLDQI